MKRRHERLAQRRRRFGDVLVPNSIEVPGSGKRVILLGDLMLEVDATSQPLLIMSRMLVETLGREWFKQELERPPQESHPAISWSRATVDSIQSGPVIAWSLLAWDAWVLRSHLLLDPLLPRLRDPRGFQGVRYELTIYALFIRGGFIPKPENERHNKSKHVEFIAKHRLTGEQIAVEAKSRRRPGVLGFPARPGASVEDSDPGITGLLRDALAKRPDMPYVVSFDLNLPPAVDEATINQRFDAARAEVELVWREFVQNGEAFPIAMVILTNYSHHYGDPSELDPRWHHCIVNIPQAAHPFTHADTREQIIAALLAYGNLPRGWDELDL
jgi:hypothetical protein